MQYYGLDTDQIKYTVLDGCATSATVAVTGIDTQDQVLWAFAHGAAAASLSTVGVTIGSGYVSFDDDYTDYAIEMVYLDYEA